MIEKTNAGADIIRASAIQIDFDRYLGFVGITFNFTSAHACSPFGFFWAFGREMSNKTLAIHTIVTTLNAMLRHIVIVLLSALFVTGCTLVPESKAEKKAKKAAKAQREGSAQAAE